MVHGCKRVRNGKKTLTKQNVVGHTRNKQLHFFAPDPLFKINYY